MNGNKLHRQDLNETRSGGDSIDLRDYLSNYRHEHSFNFSEHGVIMHQFLEYVIQSEVINARAQKQLTNGTEKASSTFENQGKARHLFEQYINFKVLESDRYDAYQKTANYRTSKMADRLYQKGKTSVNAFKASTSDHISAKDWNRQTLLLVPENGYDMFYQEVIDNEFFKKAIMQMKGTKKYNLLTKRQGFKNVMELWYEGYLHHLSWFVDFYLNDARQSKASHEIKLILKRVIKGDEGAKELVEVLQRLFVDKDKANISKVQSSQKEFESYKHQKKELPVQELIHHCMNPLISDTCQKCIVDLDLLLKPVDYNI